MAKVPSYLVGIWLVLLLLCTGCRHGFAGAGPQKHGPAANPSATAGATDIFADPKHLAPNWEKPQHLYVPGAAVYWDDKGYKDKYSSEETGHEDPNKSVSWDLEFTSTQDYKTVFNAILKQLPPDAKPKVKWLEFEKPDKDWPAVKQGSARIQTLGSTMQWLLLYVDNTGVPKDYRDEFAKGKPLKFYHFMDSSGWYAYWKAHPTTKSSPSR